MRWLAAQHRSSLLDFHGLEQASTGPFGALTALLCCRRSRYSLGSAIILLSVSFEACLQQTVLIAVPSAVPILKQLIFNRDSPDPGISTFIRYLGQHLKEFEPYWEEATPLIEDSTRCLIFYASHAPKRTTSSCERASCEYNKPHATLELCSECSNISKDLVWKCYGNDSDIQDCPWLLPSGLALHRPQSMVLNTQRNPTLEVPGSIADPVVRLEAISQLPRKEEHTKLLAPPPPIEPVRAAHPLQYWVL